MAAITVVKARPVTPPAYEFNSKAQAKVALTAGTLVGCVADTPSSGYAVVVDKFATADAGSDKKRFMVLMDCAAGAVASLGSHGEMDGYSGLPVGDPLYPSGAVAGGIDTAATAYYSAGTTPAVAVPAIARMWAVTATRLYFSL